MGPTLSLSEVSGVGPPNMGTVAVSELGACHVAAWSVPGPQRPMMNDLAVVSVSLMPIRERVGASKSRMDEARITMLPAVERMQDRSAAVQAILALVPACVREVVHSPRRRGPSGYACDDQQQAARIGRARRRSCDLQPTGAPPS